jgi:aspartate/methionine/tyrosine aminotransferase
VLPPAELAELVALCDGHGARLLCDEINRGVEPDPGQALPQAADLSERALSLNGLGKTYGLPGLRIGWIACRDPDLLVRLERAKHYTSICNATPSEVLARVALRARDRLLARTRAIIAGNRALAEEFFAEFAEWFEYAPPQGGCICFPRYRGPGDVETFCRDLVERAGVLLVPASVFSSDLAPVPADRFRIGLGRLGAREALDAFAGFLRVGGGGGRSPAGAKG